MHSEIITAGKEIYPFKSIKGIIGRVLFFKEARKLQHELDTFIEKINNLGYARIFKQSPHVLGAIQWPYIHNEWGAPKRFSVIADHYEILKTKAKYLDTSYAQELEIVDLSEFSPNTRLVVDRPSWFIREGEVAINIFQDDLRVMTIAFSFGLLDGDLVVYIGGIQGIHAGVPSDESLEIIKKMTKNFQGMRPRSFLIDVLRMLALTQGVKRIFAISDAHRHHRHSYFKGYLDKLSTSNYDDVWLEHGGIANENGFFEIPLDSQRKDIADVSSNKRSMYRKRYAMLDQVNESLAALT